MPLHSPHSPHSPSVQARGRVLQEAGGVQRRVKRAPGARVASKMHLAPEGAVVLVDRGPGEVPAPAADPRHVHLQVAVVHGPALVVEHVPPKPRGAGVVIGHGGRVRAAAATEGECAIVADNDRAGEAGRLDVGRRLDEVGDVADLARAELREYSCKTTFHDVRNDVSDRETVNHLSFEAVSHRETVNHCR